MNRDHKIEKINAYRRLLETRKLPKISVLEDAEANHLVAKELHSEFEAWVSGQISILLGETLVNSKLEGLPFDDEEINILKTLVAGVKARKQAPAPIPAPSESAPIKKSNLAIKAPEAPLSDAERSRLNATAKPLGNRRMADANKANNNDALVSALERMENEGPEY